MHRPEHRCPSGHRQPTETSRWYDDLREIMASEALYTVPNCEYLLDRVIARREAAS